MRKLQTLLNEKKASTHFFTDEFQWSLTSLGAGVDGVQVELMVYK